MTGGARSRNRSPRPAVALVTPSFAAAAVTETTMKRTLFGALVALGLAATPSWAGSGHACKASSQECLDHMTKDFASRGWLGVHLEPKDDGSMAIVDVLPDSPAAKAGLQPGDVL